MFKTMGQIFDIVVTVCHLDAHVPHQSSRIQGLGPLNTYYGSGPWEATVIAVVSTTTGAG